MLLYYVNKYFVFVLCIELEYIYSSSMVLCKVLFKMPNENTLWMGDVSFTVLLVVFSREVIRLFAVKPVCGLVDSW